MTDEEQVEKATRRLQGIRRMRPAQGWNGVQFDYIEIVDDVPYMVNKSGKRNRTILYTAGHCLRALATGEWIEI